MEILIIVNDEDGIPLCQVEAKTLESLQEQLRKVEHVICKYQTEQKELILNTLCL